MNYKYNPIDKGHCQYQNYFELINFGDLVFKYALVWWFIRDCKQSLTSDYEYEFYFLRRLTIDEIKIELENRLQTITHTGNIKGIDITNIDDIAEQLYDKFINICKTAKSNMSFSNEQIIHGVNRIIRCFYIAGLLKEPIPTNTRIYCLVRDYVNQTFKRHINFNW